MLIMAMIQCSKWFYIYFFFRDGGNVWERWWMADVVASMDMVITVIVLQQRSRPCYS